ncbi:ArnT family glycosyltransferase [Phragmitibacter flavus]|uniref:ArnT family glycosyltransferase n=1 Tax=Phragmitibacter flavus TaxID=2576071 RepID=UPI0014081F76|nr:glycosyltransferase family 39 protein [Phragmitibacter flavus]
MQSKHGAWQSDLGGDPDEAAHAVTSLMVRDYVVHSFGSHPLEFADAYYARYPKVALGHYPPGYYALVAVVLTLFSSIQTLLVLQAVLAASVATFLVWFGSRTMSVWLGLVAGVAWCMTMPVLKLSMLVMADFFLVLMCLAATGAFALFMRKPKAAWALAFGVFASMAILIKGSGWMLALLPPIAIGLAKEWRLLIKPSLWLAPLPVLLLALPWQWFSFRFTEEGMSGLSPAGHFMEALPFYGRAFVDNYGWPLALVMVIALVQLVWRWGSGSKVGFVEAALWALLLSGAVMMMSVPAGLSSRYFLPLSAPMMLLVVLSMSRWLDWFSWPPLVKVGAVGLVMGISVGSLVSLPKLAKEVKGFSNGVLMVHEEGIADHGTMLICSDARGEGAMVAAAAFDEGMRGLEGFRMLRASKVLAEIDWLGRGNEELFASDQEMLKYLEQQRVEWVLVDQSVAEVDRPAYFGQLTGALKAADGEWSQWREVKVQRAVNDFGSMQIFRRIGPPKRVGDGV